MNLGKQSTLNDLKALGALIDQQVSQVNSLAAEVQNFSDVNELNTFMRVRAPIITDDFFLDREIGIYKVQNGSTTPNPNRPPETTWGPNQLYGSLVVYRSEISGERRMVIDFLSDSGNRYTAHSNNGGWSAWSEIPVIGETAIVDADGFIKKV